MATEEKTTLVKEPSIPRFSTNNCDLSIDPLKDFYAYAAGGWIRRNPVPKNKTDWNSFDELYEWNLSALKKILDDSKNGRSGNGSPGRLVGEFYSSAMNTSRIQSLGFGAARQILDHAHISEKGENFAREIAKLHKSKVNALFFSYSMADKKNSSTYAFYLHQGGLSLPDREYYLADSFNEIREAYLEHISRMFNLLGYEESKSMAEIVLDFEIELAKISKPRADLRDEEKNYHRITLPELKSEFPSLSLVSYLESLRVPKTEFVVVGQPDFFSFLDKLVLEKPLKDIQTYLIWHVLHAYAPFLHLQVEDEDFDFFHRKLLGQVEPEPRWKISSRVVDDLLGEALGKLYVEKHFPPDAKRRVMLLVEDIQDAFRERLLKVPWMTDATRAQALAKFSKFRVKIGHPERFRDYSSIQLDPLDYVGNVIRASEFEANRQALRVGSPVDRAEWLMTPPTVNAYFSPTDNEIVFPAGILQPPFFDVTMDDAVNYGGIGGVIGHEITHGYDDQGRKFDSEGNLRDWWTADDEKEFKSRSEEVKDLYSSQEALPELHVNGELTLGENIADFGGLSLAFSALQKRLEKEPEKRKKIDGLSPEQRFFIAWAQIWKQNIRDEELRRLLTIDPHSPCRFRAVLPAINHPAFGEAFNDGSRSKSSLISVW